MSKYFLIALQLVVFSVASLAQKTKPHNGPKAQPSPPIALVGATVQTAPGKVINNATILIKDGKIEEIGTDVKIPAQATVHDVSGKFIYPSFIDLHSNYGLPKPERTERGPNPYESSDPRAVNWNEAIKLETRAANLFSPQSSPASRLRKMGFGTVLTHQQDGIARGTSALVTLNIESAHEAIISADAAQHFSFKKGTSKQSYPSSLMGAIALMRQTFYDAQWYEKNRDKEGQNLSLDAMLKNRELPAIFESSGWQDALRISKIAKEFKLNYAILGSGDEYQRAQALQAIGAVIIIPVNYPKAFDVEDPTDAKWVTTTDLKHWEWAPFNARTLTENKIGFCLTANGVKDHKTFFKNLRKTIVPGLSPDDLLRALTQTPASVLKMEKRVGSLEKGKIANLLIFDAPWHEDESVLLENYIQGERFIIEKSERVELRNSYKLSLGEYQFILKGKGKNIKNVNFSLDVDSAMLASTAYLKGKKKSVKVNAFQNSVSVFITITTDSTQENWRLAGFISKDGEKWTGTGISPNGTEITWQAQKFESNIAKPDTVKPHVETVFPGKITYPFTAFGFDTVPKHSNFLIENTTVWSNSKKGIQENTDVWIKDGKIHRIGKKLRKAAEGSGSLTVIDGTGMHVTPGMIDEHSHIAISRGVNESGTANSAQVSISDVVNSEDINIFRQLAGGTTAAQLLHGSANPIGGQSAIIKLRWGRTPEEMKIAKAPGFIKFALGENVKQSNWGGDLKIRYPQSRMGVEQVYYDAFYQAKAYKQAWDDYLIKEITLGPKAVAPRKDLTLETLVEILDGKRFITCHSYVQSEINMLMHVADSMGFMVNTFTHILEGYKVADKMKKHGAAGSTFSDWWAYKFEVNDAIPYNAALMHRQGVLTAINSDDAEMGRRLNQEAGKTVKYGGVSEEDALKFVTLNPAIMLKLDGITGTIEQGKDADVVLWTDRPLSIYARASKTWVDGLLLWDEVRFETQKSELEKERNRIIQKMLEAKKNGESLRKVARKKEIHYHCDTEVDYE